jgi:hypothetical protein
MEQLQQPQKKMIGIEPIAENGSVDVFGQVGVTGE